MSKNNDKPEKVSCLDCKHLHLSEDCNYCGALNECIDNPGRVLGKFYCQVFEKRAEEPPKT